MLVSISLLDLYETASARVRGLRWLYTHEWLTHDSLYTFVMLQCILEAWKSSLPILHSEFQTGFIIWRISYSGFLLHEDHCVLLTIICLVAHWQIGYHTMVLANILCLFFIVLNLQGLFKQYLTCPCKNPCTHTVFIKSGRLQFVYEAACKAFINFAPSFYAAQCHFKIRDAFFMISDLISWVFVQNMKYGWMSPKYVEGTLTLVYFVRSKLLNGRSMLNNFFGAGFYSNI